MIGAEARVGVPGTGRTVAVKDLDEADPALGQPAGRQELLAERTCDIVVQTVKTLRRSVLIAESQDLGHGRLHPEGQLVRLDPGAQLGVLGILQGRQPVQPAKEFRP